MGAGNQDDLIEPFFHMEKYLDFIAEIFKEQPLADSDTQAVL